MRPLFAAVGIDFDQWKALTIAALKLDFRAPSLGAQQAHRSVAGGLVVQAIFYTIFGALLSRLVWVNRDLFLVGTVLATYVTFLVGTAILLDHNSTITSPNDYGILGFRPVTSRTFFAVKLTNLLVYTNGVTTMAVWLPIVAATIRYGPAVGMASALAVYGCSTAVTLTIVMGYASMLRMFGADAIRRAFSYVQLVMSFLVYGGALLMSSVLSARVLGGLSLPEERLDAAVFLQLGRRISRSGRRHGVIVRGGCRRPILRNDRCHGVGARRAVIPGYSERLGAMTTSTTARVRRPAGGAWGPGWFRSGERESGGSASTEIISQRPEVSDGRAEHHPADDYLHGADVS